MNNFEDFNWAEFEGNHRGGNRLIPNEKIKGQDNHNICYSRAPYAQKMFDLLSDNNSQTIKKDLTKGDCVVITDIYNVRLDKMSIELSGGLSVDIDLSREKRFLQIFGYNTVDQFVEDILKPQFKVKFLEQGIYAYVIESSPTIKISLWQGHLKKIREEFMKEIESPSKAYVAKVMEANKGGYFVEVQGIEAFMPGSLAAPNKIIDFRTLVGKEVIVMVEDFLKEMNSFIVSHKKYIEHVLPRKIAELDLNHKYTGNITGTSKYGIFVEFGDIFTGLLHNSKMKEDTLRDFRNRKYNPGDQISFYINEITKDNRIILTEESPEEKREKFTKFILENKEKVIDAEVAAVMNFGVIVNVGELSGLVPNKEFKRRKIAVKNYVVGDKFKVKIADFKDDKLVFDLISEDKKQEEGV